MCVCERVCVREEKIPAYPQKSRISVQKSSIVLFRIDAGTYYMYVRVQVRITCTYVCMYVLHVRTCACTYYMYVRVHVRITCTYVCRYVLHVRTCARQCVCESKGFSAYSQKSPISLQTSPASLPKSLISLQKSPISLQKSPISLQKSPV